MLLLYRYWKFFIYWYTVYREIFTYLYFNLFCLRCQQINVGVGEFQSLKLSLFENSEFKTLCSKRRKGKHYKGRKITRYTVYTLCLFTLMALNKSNQHDGFFVLFLLLFFGGGNGSFYTAQTCTGITSYHMIPMPRSSCIRLHRIFRSNCVYI